MADITAIVNTNTFDEQMSTINEAYASTMLLAFSSTVPLDAAVTTNTAILFVDSSGNFKLKKNDDGIITTHTVTISAAE